MEQKPILIDLTGFKLGENPTELERIIARNLAFYQSRGECLDNIMTSQQVLRGSRYDYRLGEAIARMPAWKRFLCLKCSPIFKILFPFEFVI